MSDRLKTSYGVFEQDDFVEESGQLRELTVTITLSEYRELVSSSVLQRDYIDRIDELTLVIDSLCRMVLNSDPELENAIISMCESECPPAVFEALARVAKERDTDA